MDAVVGRHPFQATSIMAGAGAYDRVVVHLGANSPYTTASFDQAMQTLVGAGFAPNEVVWVTIQLPDASYPHEGPTNTVIRQGAARWGARLADWNLLSGANPSYLYFDGIHLTATGASAYTAMVVSALG